MIFHTILSIEVGVGGGQEGKNYPVMDGSITMIIRVILATLINMTLW